MILHWKRLPVKLFENNNLAFAVGTGHNLNITPIWVRALDIDDFEAFPTSDVSPLHTCFAHGRRIPRELGVVFLQTKEPMPFVVHAVWNCFGI